MEQDQIKVFLEETLEISKRENVPQIDVILYNVKNTEGMIKQHRFVGKSLRTTAPLFEAEIRPLKLKVRELSRLPATPENCKKLSESRKRLNILRGYITQINLDIHANRETLKFEHAILATRVAALRDWYNQNPDTGETTSQES